MENNFKKTADRAAYEMEPAVRKTVRDYAEEINAALKDTVETVETMEQFVGGYEKPEGTNAQEVPGNLMEQLEQAQSKAKYLRGQVWQLSKLMQ